MKIILSTVVLFTLLYHASAQNQSLDARKHFDYTDTLFEVGEVKYIYGLFWYDVGQAYLTYPIMDSLVSFLYYYPELNIEIGSYTDSRGNDKYNLKLSEARARDVYYYAVGCGITSNRISWKGYGEAFPIAPNEIGRKDNPEGQWLNRRTEIKITSIVGDQEKFIRPTLLYPTDEIIHFLFGKKASAFPLTLLNVRSVENIIDLDRELDTFFLKKYKSCARSYFGFIDATGDRVVMVGINFSSPPRNQTSSLFDSNALSKTQILFVNLSKRICLKSF